MKKRLSLRSDCFMKKHVFPSFSMGRCAQFFNPTFKRLNITRNTFSGRNRKGGEAVLLPC